MREEVYQYTLSKSGIFVTLLFELANFIRDRLESKSTVLRWKILVNVKFE